MKRALGKILCGATLLLGLPLTFTSCEEILGEWSKPAPVPGAPNTPTPSPTPTPASKTAGAISYATGSLAKGSQDPAFTNELTITGDGTVSYSSSNEAVATVDPNTGEVTPKGTGTVEITATVSDSETYTYETNTASYSLEVKDGYQYQEWDDVNKKFTTKYAATSAYQELADAASAAWDGTKTYVAKGNVTISGDVTVSANSELILCDGATLTISGKLKGEGGTKDLTIYAQSDGTKMGALNATADMAANGDNTIRFSNLTIHGGKISVTAKGSSYTDCEGICVVNALTMYGGDLTAQGNGNKGAGLQIQTVALMNNAKLEAKGGDNNSGEGDDGISATSSGATISVSDNAILIATGGSSSGNNGGKAVCGPSVDPKTKVIASGNARVTLTGGKANSGTTTGGHGVSGNVTASGNASLEITAGDGCLGGTGILYTLTISENASVNVKGGNATNASYSAGDAIDLVDYKGGSLTATGGVNDSDANYNGKGIKTSITNNSASDVDFEYGTDGSNWTTKQVAKTNTWSDATVNSLYIRTKP